MSRQTQPKRQSDSLPLSTWLKLKPQLATLYLDHNWTNTRVRQWIKEKYGHDITARMLKSKFDSWNWDKKIRDPMVYFAMEAVIKNDGMRITFDYPSLRICNKAAQDVIKEVNRQSKRNQRSRYPIQGYEHASEILRSKGVIVNYPGPVNHSGPVNQLALREPLSFLGREQQQYDSDETSGGQSDGAEVFISDTEESDDGTIDHLPSDLASSEERLAGPLPAGSHEAASQSSGPMGLAHCLTGQLHPRMIISQELQQHEAVVAVRDNDFDYLSRPQYGPMDEMTKSLAEMLSGDWESYLGINLRSAYQRFDRDGTKRMVVEFAAYYVQQARTEDQILDPHDHSDRIEARENLKALLRKPNAEILPAIYWISSVIGNHDKVQQVKAFYEDCWECVEAVQDLGSWLLRPIIKLGLLAYEETSSLGDVYSHERLQKADELIMNSGIDMDLCQCLDFLKTSGRDRTATFVIISMLRASYFEIIGCYDDCLQILLSKDGLPLSGPVMGWYHLVYAHCLALASKCYMKKNIPGMAENYLEQALMWLEECANPLQPYRYRLVRRLARVQLYLGKVSEGLHNMEEAFSFSLATFGPVSSATWDLARELFEALAIHGRASEASQRRQELKQLYEVEWLKDKRKNREFWTGTIHEDRRRS